jgi:RimJ/RimL family protein N-acetyltransferase
MSEVWRSAPDLVKDAAAAPATWLAAALKMFGLQEEARFPEGPGIAARGRFYPVRTLSADDTDALRTFLQDGLSEESRRLRFMSAMPTVPESAAAWLANRDGHDRVALAALDPDDPDKVVAVVEYAAVDGGPPEVAVAVADAFQGQGIGTSLLKMLATLTLASGQTQWSCDVLADNDGPLRLLANVGDVILGGVTDGVRGVTVTLDPKKLFGVHAQ